MMRLPPLCLHFMVVVHVDFGVYSVTCMCSGVGVGRGWQVFVLCVDCMFQTLVWLFSVQVVFVLSI